MPYSTTHQPQGMIGERRKATRQFDLDWPHGHETLSGMQVTILERRLRGDYPLSVVIHEDNADDLLSYAQDGTFDLARPNTTLNLRNRPAP